MRRSILLTVLLLTVFVANALCSPIDPNDTFDGPSVNPSLWIEDLNGTGSSNNGSMAGNYQFNGPGNGWLFFDTNFYFNGDFSITFTVYPERQGSVPSNNFFNILFFEHGQAYSVASYGETWGYIGDNIGSFQGAWTSLPGLDTELYGHWYEVQIRRIDDDMSTAYREVGSTPWTTANEYENIGTESIYMRLQTGTGSSWNTIALAIDEVSITGHADTDPFAIPIDPVPEPLSICLLGISCALIYLKRVFSR